MHLCNSLSSELLQNTNEIVAYGTAVVLRQNHVAPTAPLPGRS